MPSVRVPHAFVVVAAAVVSSCLAFIGHPATAQFQTVDHPIAGATGSTVLQKVDGDTAVGIANNFTTNQQRSFWFNLTTSAITPIANPDASSAESTLAFGTSSGSATGYYHKLTPTGEYHGFLYNGTSFTNFDYPAGAGVFVNTYAQAIDAGVVVGKYDSQGAVHGFVRSAAGAFTTIDSPGMLSTSAYGVDGTRIVGETLGPGGFPDLDGFLYDGVTWTPLSYPGATLTRARDIEGNLVVGTWSDPSAGGRERGFIYDIAANTWAPYDAPDTNTFTSINGISGSKIVGSYTSGGATHGFIATIPEPACFAALAAIALALTARRAGRAG